MNAPMINPRAAGCVDQIDWQVVSDSLFAQGYARLGTILTPDDCAGLIAHYDAPAGFRSHIHMARHGFGQGEYKYFSYPLPDLVANLRAAFYAPLTPIAARWAERLGRARTYPETHAAFRAECAAMGQGRPTPLMLRYKKGDYNCLHQDLYGELYFPFQIAVVLNAPGTDFTGGEFVLVENRPRMQSKCAVVPLGLGEAVIFAVNERPRLGSRGYHRTALRHGVSELTSGTRHTLGIIFHDGK